jgi:hypothetical protein
MRAEARHEAELAADAAHDIDQWMRGALRRGPGRTGSDRVVGGPIAEPYRLLESGGHAAAARASDELGCRLDAALALLDASCATHRCRLPAGRREAAGAPGLPAYGRLRLPVAVAQASLSAAGTRVGPAGPGAETRRSPRTQVMSHIRTLCIAPDGAAAVPEGIPAP